MRTVLLLARKELASFFDSLMAYLILAAFLGTSGFFTWWFGTDVFMRGLADLSTFFNTAYWTLFFFIPAITMRTIADERRTGTLDLLLTKAVTDRQVVAGKYLACVILIALALLCTLPYWFTIAAIGKVDHGSIACGYLALLCMSSAYIALGILASSFTNNQIVAFLIGLSLVALFHLAFPVMASNFTGPVGRTLHQLGTQTHFDSMSRGIIDSRDLLWFGSITLLGLVLAELNLAKRLINGWTMTRARLLRNALLITVVFVLVNMIGQRLKFRWDLTADQRYSLSPATIDLLKGLPEAVTVTAWFTERMPPDLAVARQDFKDLLVEYAARSNGNVVFEFIDPNSADSLAQQAQAAGIKPMLATTREQDRIENLQVYMGCTVHMGERGTVIPAIQQGSALEWAVSSAIKEVSAMAKPLVGIVQMHGEASIGELNQLVQNLNVMYTVQPTAIFDSVPINDNFAALVFVGPRDSIPPMQLDRLHDFLVKGKGVVIAYDPVRSDLGSSPVAEVVRTNLEPWLEAHGLRVEPNIVVDQKCNQVQVMQQMGNLSMPVAINFPYFPVLNGFAEHPITQGVDVVTYQFCAPISPALPDSSLLFTPFLFTSTASGTLTSPHVIDIRRQWVASDFTAGSVTVGAEVVGPFGPGAAPGRLILFTNGGFCVSGSSDRPVQLPPGNLDIMVNAVDRASGQNELAGLRGKEITYRPIEQLGDGTRATLKWTNLLLPVLLTVAYGMARRTWRRVQRKRRMAPDHVR